MSYYGTDSELLSSQALTPVSTETVLVFVGNSASGTANEPELISSYSDFKSKFGASTTLGLDGLATAARVAFERCHIRQAVFISVGIGATPTDVDMNDMIGDATEQTGLYAIQKVYPKLGLVPSLIVPTIFADESDVREAVEANCAKINGHWDCMYLYQVEENSDEVITGTHIVHAANVISRKDGSSERGIPCWPHVKLGNEYVSANIYVACLMALADADFDNIPIRTQGNLSAAAMSGMYLLADQTAPLDMSEETATQLADSGITSFINVGAGRYYTWGDGTAALSSTGIADERGRFTSTIRVLLRLGNRFQQVWRNTINAPLDLELRNAILKEEQGYLDYLKSQGALLGYPRCEFRPDDNTIETIQSGRFYFTNILTVTAPARYIDLKIVFTSEGYSVLLAA